MKGIQDSLGFWIPRRGFRISGIGSQYLSVEFGFWIPIPDSLSCIPDSKAKDSEFHEQKFADSGIPHMRARQRSQLTEAHNCGHCISPFPYKVHP